MNVLSLEKEALRANLEELFAFVDEERQTHAATSPRDGHRVALPAGFSWIGAQAQRFLSGQW